MTGFTYGAESDYPPKASDITASCWYENVCWPGNDFSGKCLLEQLVNTIGTEKEIRTRQRWLLVRDMIENKGFQDRTVILSGSLAEGLDLPGSDIDIMLVLEKVNVLQNIRDIKHPIPFFTLVMETETNHPGFTRLKSIDEAAYCFEPCGLFESNRGGVYIPVNGFLNIFIKSSQRHLITVYQHGPCLTGRHEAVDVAWCFKSKYFPDSAIPWLCRQRNKWPPNNVIDRIINYGCLLVPIGPRTVTDSNLLWRISFSVAEKHLVHSFNFTQLLCYGLLKLTLKRIINNSNDVKDLLCSYFLKTALFWVSEEVDIEKFQLNKLLICFSLCLNKIISWVKNCYCPNYFIPEQNMFLGKITQDNNEILVRVLDRILFSGSDELLINLFPSEERNYHLESRKRETSSIMLDFLFYRICRLTTETDISDFNKVLTFTASLIKSESSSFIVDACKYQYAKMNQYAAQRIPPPTTTREIHNIHKRYHQHLRDGIKADDASGWLLYASFCYLTKQYKVALRLADNVLLKDTPHTVYIGCQEYEKETINNYKQHVDNSLNLNDKIKISTVGRVIFMEHSPFIPIELQLEVEHVRRFVPPFVMSHCLRFLCYHHLGDMYHRGQALFQLYSTVKRSHFIALTDESVSFTILGVCFEIAGHKHAAYHCYDEALNCYYPICISAETRKSKLFDD